jgi:hypothetical protein
MPPALDISSCMKPGPFLPLNYIIQAGVILCHGYVPEKVAQIECKIQEYFLEVWGLIAHPVQCMTIPLLDMDLLEYICTIYTVYTHLYKIDIYFYTMYLFISNAIKM